MMLEVLSVVAAVGLGQVTLRGVEAAPAVRVVEVNAAGVWVVARGPEGEAVPAAAGQRQVIGWDRVKSVGGEHAEPAGAFAEVADALWRARTRLERGDYVASEPLFERLFESYRGERGPTAAVIAEGLLRCRVRRAAHVAAVEPWLALLMARQGNPAAWIRGDWASEAGLGSVIDSTTGLVPSLPPIWLNWPSVAAWARTEPAATEDQRTAALAGLYLASARFEAGIEHALPAVASNDPGVQIVLEIVTARVGDKAQRETARAKLAERLKRSSSSAPPPWLEAWCRAGIGRSLIRESDPDLRRLGVVELLHVPARFARAHPYLAGVALAEAAATVRELGDRAGADVLVAELVSLYPTHPVRDWAALGGRTTAAPPAAKVLPPTKITTPDEGR